MKLGSFATIARLVEERRQIQRKLEERIEITIGNAFQTQEFVDAIKPSIHVQLHLRIEQIEQKLIALGVSIDE